MKTVMDMKPTGFQNGTTQSLNNLHDNSMKQYFLRFFRPVAALSLVALAFGIQSCKKDNLPQPDNLSQPAITKTGTTVLLGNLGNESQTNLVANISGYAATKIDPNLQNAWGIAFGPKDGIFIAANHTGMAMVYNGNGQSVGTPISVPLPNGQPGGSPTGVVYNDTKSFAIPKTNVISRVIFATEDGTIAAWSSGHEASIVVDNSASNAVYKGITMAESDGSFFLYATDFHNNKIDMFDANFNQVSAGIARPIFRDPDMPANFAPFGIQTINNRIYVTYAMQKGPDNMDDQSGPGNGYVDIYALDGTFLSRFLSNGNLNSPWGLAMMPGNLGTLLVGNFGDGHINAYDSKGVLLGQVMDNHKAIAIDGLWAISYGSDPHDVNRLYFTAGPNGEHNGLFGYLQKK